MEQSKFSNDKCQQWKLSKNQQLRLENRIMQRPPRPLIKSAQLFPFSQIRKVFTPDCPQPEAEIVPALPHQQIKSMRDASVTADMHRSLNQVENIEYLEISKASNAANSKTNTNILSGCSFKIRNFTYSKSRGIKQNSIPLKSTHKPSSSSINTGSSHIEQIKLKSYPHSLELASVGSKIAYHKLSAPTDQVKLFDQWAVIISQSLFSGSFLQEINLMKLKSLVQHCRKYHSGMHIILRLHNDRNVGDIISKISEKTISLDYVIWGKHKYFQTVNTFDITQIVKDKKINRYIVMEDSHQVIKNLYYLSQQSQLEKQGEDKIKQYKQLDFKSKFSYLKFNGLANLMKFAQKFRVSVSDDEIIAEKRGCMEDTETLFSLKQLHEKIRIAGQRKKLKIVKHPERRISSDVKSLKNSCDLNSKQLENDKNEQFKKKIIQYAKILQEEHKINDMRSKSIDKKEAQRNQSLKGGPLKLVTQRAETPSTSKSSHQLVGQLLKNNALIHKQILKYQQKLAKVNIQLNQNFM